MTNEANDDAFADLFAMFANWAADVDLERTPFKHEGFWSEMDRTCPQ